ncbi:hypothetical protein AKJ59_00435 [candidate division MSBL1 archaeon SCGC-AAA385M02]|uniref:Uncharacterized protein n=1 Tax=candidate division MSBL1 archaeon SCGC-AAA385M02 TaxID=1698287 RepID=A0A133VQZ0_9EURY|nr:hypothetical protein AKJ59_00435 [candidate division MSBL1 archaeon SCGC-AAA385M02]
MADYGLRVSKPGYDVLTDADKYMVFSSKFDDAFKARYSGSTTLTISDGGTANTSYTHSYNAIPAFLAYYKDPTDNKYLMCAGNENSWWILSSTDILCTAKVDSSNIYFYGRNDSGSQQTINIYFHLFYEAGGNI